MFLPWQPIPPMTSWGELAPGTVLLYTDVDALVVDARPRADKVRLRLQRLDGERFDRTVDPRSTIQSEAGKHLGGHGDGLRAMALPAVLWKEDSLFTPRNIVALLATAVVSTLLVIISGNSAWYLAFMAGGAAGVWVRRAWKRGNELTFLAPDRLGITMETILPYALTREQGKLWVPPSAGADRRQLAYQRVGAIRDAYLALREDIAFRIESPALFDPTVPATAEFETALVMFEDVGDATPTEEVDARASEVEVTFNVARANAERLGLAHLPEDKRDDARRASKAARLAEGATTEGERVASLNQVKRILDSLALHYMPTIDDRKEIEGGR